VTRLVVRAAGAVVLAALLAGPSAQARAPHTSAHPAQPAVGHTSNEWLMMGRNCGAGMGGG
jgi:hypothetical protein